MAETNKMRFNIQDKLLDDFDKNKYNIKVCFQKYDHHVN